MEEDTTQYFNDEWNLEIKEFKNITSKDFIEKYIKVIDKNGNSKSIILREIDKEFLKRIDNIKNKDVNKYTK